MSLIHLEFPVLVEHRQGGYRLKPLLFDGPVVSRQRYGDALKGLQKAVKEHYRHKTLDTTMIEPLLWFSFQPEHRFELLHIAFRSGMHMVDGLFAAAFYRVQKTDYVCFPHLDHLSLRIPEDIRQRPVLLNFLTEKLIRYFQLRKKDEDSPFDVHQQYAAKSCSTVSVSVAVEVKDDKFSFEEQGTSLWALLSQNPAFNGAEELDKVAEDLSGLGSAALEECYFREPQVQWLQRAMLGTRPQAVAIVGEPGIGKSNLVHYVYKQYLQAHSTTPSSKLQKLWRLDPLRVISGMSIVGQWERRFETILSHIKKRIQKIHKSTRTDILVIDNPIALLRVGKTSQSELTLAHILMDYMARRDFPVVLEATPQQWQKLQDVNRRFADMFQVLRLAPLSPNEVNHVTTVRRAHAETHYECEFTTQALLTLVRVEPSLRGVKTLPGSLVEILRTIAITSQNQRVDETRVYQALQANYHINPAIIDKNQTITREELNSYFTQRLIGQPAARTVLVDTILSIKAQLCAPDKPLNTMLFIGPTGVGKTEAAKLLAGYLYSRPENLVRIDMNEFVDADAVARLIGDGYQRGGILTEQVRYQRSCVLLLDEIEKAHPRVHDILLQLLDDGRLTDAGGTTTDFSQTIVIMTSNIGAQEANSAMGFVQHNNDISASYLKSLEQHFRPEMINRIQNVVVFEALKAEDMKFLARLHLKNILERDGFVRRSTILNVQEPCLTLLANQGYDPHLGARALKRNLERMITHATAHCLAELNSDEPIILNMREHEGRLQSDIVRLRFAEPAQAPVPTMVSFDLAQYQQLLNDLQALDEQLKQSPFKSTGTGDADLRYTGWTLLDAVRDIKEPLQSFIFELEDLQQVRTLQVNKPFRPMAAKTHFEYRRPRIDFSGIHAHHDIREYLSDLYKRSQTYFTAEKNNEYPLWSQTTRLFHAAQCFASRGVDQGVLLIQSLVAHKGAKAVSFLANTYTALLREFGHCDNIYQQEQATLIKVTGPGIQELLQYDSGIHLFYEDNNLQIPLVVRFYPNEAAIDQDILLDEHSAILRVYALADSGHEKSTITDVRSTLMTEALHDTEQWWPFLIGALPPYGEH